MRFGLSGGIDQVKVDATNATVIDRTDEIVNSGAQSGMAFESEFGLFYSLKKLQLGISIPNILETTSNLNVANLDGFQEKRHLVGYVGYNFEINQKWHLEPSVLYKSVSNLSQLDVNAMVTFDKMFSIGLGYRDQVGALARLGVKIKDRVLLAYAYEFAGANISKYSNGSHEIMLGLTFCGKNERPQIVETPVVKTEPAKEIAEVIEVEKPKDVAIIKETPKEETPIKVEPITPKEIVVNTPMPQGLTEDEKKLLILRSTFL